MMVESAWLEMMRNRLDNLGRREMEEDDEFITLMEELEAERADALLEAMEKGTLI